MSDCINLCCNYIYYFICRCTTYEKVRTQEIIDMLYEQDEILEIV